MVRCRCTTATGRPSGGREPKPTAPGAGDLDNFTAQLPNARRPSRVSTSNMGQADPWKEPDMTYILTQDEALWLHNDAAHKGAFGEVDYDHEEHHAGWARMAQANPDGNTTGEHVPGTVDGTNVRVTSTRQEDQRQYNTSRSSFVRVPAAPTQVEPFDLVRVPSVRERFTVSSELGSVRPQGAVTVTDADGITWTTVPQGAHKGYDGTETTQRRVAGAIAAAKRVARNDASCTECVSANNGECDKCEKRRAARERKRRQRARQRTERERESIKEATARAVAVASAGWDANDRA